MAFSQPSQPGVTRYPNLLPVQAVGYPDGVFLAMLAESDRVAYERVVKEGVKQYNEMLVMQIEAYEKGMGVKRIAQPERRLALYLLKKPDMWRMQAAIFPKKADHDWVDFTLLAERAYKGDFEDEQGVPFDPEMVRAIWRISAQALGVIQAPQVLPVQGAVA